VAQLYGYARMSNGLHNPRLQTAALRAAGCTRIFTDKASGKPDQRPELDKLLAKAGSGDVVVVWRLDRLGRSLKHLVATLSDLGERDVGFRSLTEAIDTTAVGGALLLHLVGALAEFERQLIVERTHAGLSAARARGRHGGRPRKVDDAKIALIRQLYDSQEHSVDAIASMVGVGRTTVYRSLDSATRRSPPAAPPMPAKRGKSTGKVAP
jgi:DNA invertase Pin-like site-specific DNA recombinase